MTLPKVSVNWDTTAEEIMSQSPMSIRAEAELNEAISFLIDKGFGAAPVIDASGRPVGVISQSDIVTCDRERVGSGRHAFHDGETTPPVQVRDVMTPGVFQIPTSASLARVVEEMVALNVHRLFVVGPDGTLVGVITALDLLRHMYHQLRQQSADFVTAS